MSERFSLLSGVPMLFTPVEFHPAPTPGSKEAVWARNAMTASVRVAEELGL